MAFLTKYGTLWGAIPQTAGRVFWVAPSASYTVDGRAYTASDANDGLSPEKALLTVDRAWNLVSANVGDVIVLLPGTHSPTASIAADVAGVTMMGLPGGRGHFRKQRATIAAVTGDQNVNVTAADIEIAYINFIPVTADTAIDASSAAHRLHIHNCSFDLATPAASTGTKAIEYLGAAADGIIEECYFHSNGAQGEAIATLSAVRLTIRRNEIYLSAGTWAAAMSTGAGADGVLIYENYFHAGNATITAGILGTTGGTASAVACWRNVFPDSATVAIDTFDAGTAELAENYQAGVGATDGGVLIVAIT